MPPSSNNTPDAAGDEALPGDENDARSPNPPVGPISSEAHTAAASSVEAAKSTQNSGTTAATPSAPPAAKSDDELPDPTEVGEDG